MKATEILSLNRFADKIPGENVLCINPRAGELPLSFLNINHGLKFSAFVSDGEWREAVHSFCKDIFFGCSHTPLTSIPTATYDAVLVCEDMGFVDDCDAMFREYYRLLKPGGVLLGGLWNLSYADDIDQLLMGNGIKHNGELCGNATIPLDCLITRLAELGFKNTIVYNLEGDRSDATAYADVSRRNLAPVPAQIFNTLIHFICAHK